MSDIDLLPRADIPVLFNDFKTKADAVWAVVDSLVVTDVSQKEAMALARKTRLDLRNIRVAVEHRRVELGENHLKEIQKVNGAAKAIREFIEPLEARLLFQEGFAERVEADRIVELTKFRNDEVRAIWPGCPGDFGKMSETEYAALIARLRTEAEEMAEYKRKQVEAEAKLAAQQVEALRVEQAIRAEAAKLMLAQQEEQKLLDAEAERVRFEQEAKHRAELQAASAIRTLEREAEEKRLRVEREKTAAIEAQFAAERQEAEEKYRREQAEKDRIRDEQLAKLEAELKAERAVKLAEEARIRRIALAPDGEKLLAYADALRGVVLPNVDCFPAQRVVREMVCHISSAIKLTEDFCATEGLTKI